MAGQNMSNKLLTDLGSEKCIIARLPEGTKDVSELSEESLKIFVSSFDNIVSSMLQWSTLIYRANIKEKVCQL